MVVVFFDIMILFIVRFQVSILNRIFDIRIWEFIDQGCENDYGCYGGCGCSFYCDYVFGGYFFWESSYGCCVQDWESGGGEKNGEGGYYVCCG